MAKGYWIAQVDVRDPEAYKLYVKANAVPIAKFGGKFIVRGEAKTVPEGEARGRIVVVEFPDYAAALACYDSQEYREAITLRRDVCEIDLIVAEGYDGPQPG